MGRRTKIITEYRQTGGDGDADGYKIFYSVILYSVEQSTSPHAVTKHLRGPFQREAKAVSLP